MIRTLTLYVLVLTLSGCLNSWDSHTTHYKVDGIQVEVPVEVDGKPVPPDPGEDGTETLLGIDSNDNGVRDDVERYIAARFQGYDHANKERAIAMQYARAAQNILEQGPEKALETERVFNRASECEWAYYYKFRDYAYSLRHTIFTTQFEDLFFNTNARLKAYFAWNEALSGHAFSSRIEPLISDCEVEISKIEN